MTSETFALELLTALSETSSMRTFFPPCPIGAELNRVRASTPRFGHDEEGDYARRIRRRLSRLEREAGEECLSVGSCAHCPRGRDAFTRALFERYPHWQTSHIDRLLAALTQTGPDRPLPNFCDIGHQVNVLVSTGSVHIEALQPAIDSLCAEHDCLNTESCVLCERGRGVFRNLLLDLSENGMSGEAGAYLEEWP